MSNSPTACFRSSIGLATFTTIFLIADILSTILVIISLTRQLQLLDDARFGANIPPAQAVAQDEMLRVLGAVELAIAVMAAVPFLAWIHRANANSHALKTEGVRFSPGWSIGWFFVPLASFYMPYLVLRELWQANSSGTGLESRRDPVAPVLASWWGVSVLRCVNQYSFVPVVAGSRRLSDAADFGQYWLGGLQSFYFGLLFGLVVQLAADALTIVVINCITHSQERRHSVGARTSPQ
jgi:hypothetical protein